MHKQPTFHWHLELSSKCSLKCPRCPRTEKPGMFKVTEMDLEFVKSILTIPILKNTTSIILCGGQGDPIYCKDMLEIVKYIKFSNPNICIRIITNGSYKTKKWWQELSKLLNHNDTIVFSVDGWDQESNEKYRVNSNFKSIIEGITTVSENKDLTICWSTIVFSFNENNLNKIANLAKESGATLLQVVKSSLFGSKIPAYIEDSLGYDPLEPTYKNANTSKYAHSERTTFIKLTDDNTKTKISANLYKEKVKALYKEVKDQYNDILPSCLINERGLYIDAEGILYPCSWISHPFDTRQNKQKSIKWNDSLFVKYKNQFNLHEFTLNEILNGKYWKKLTNSFGKNTFVECSSKCNKVATQSRLDSIFKIAKN